jgi:uncharacterized protein YcbK (DUF882 family)
MTPLITIAIALISNVTDLTHMFVSDKDEQRQQAISFYFGNRHEAGSFALVDDKGAANLDVIKEFSHFVRCWRTNRVKEMHPRTIEVVNAVAQHFGYPTIEVVSGYRARPYGAPHSKHFIGRAMDIRVPGVPAKQVAAWIWENFRHVGVGYYPKQEFVHVDTRDVDVRWVDISRHGEGANARYFTRAPGQEALPANAPRLAFDQPKHDDAPVDSHVEMAALQTIILSTSVDPPSQ